MDGIGLKMGPNRASKRVRADDLTDSFWGEEESQSGSYLSVKLLAGRSPREKGWPWIQQCIRGILGGTEKVEKASFMSDGRLLVRTKTSTQTEKLLKARMFGDMECVVEREERLNQSRGTIHAVDLIDLSEEEIVGWLTEFGVVAARRFTRRTGSRIERTPTILLTFNRPTCPTKLDFDYVTYNVRQHIPNPLMCLQCGRFGHIQARCQSEVKCLTCGDKKHDGTCEQKCLHCGDTGHDGLSRQCEVWKKEKRVCEIKVKKDVSYAHARRIIAAETSSPTLRSYASVVRGSSDPPSDPTFKTELRVIGEKLDKMITLLDRVLKLHGTEAEANQTPTKVQTGTGEQEGAEDTQTQSQPDMFMDPMESQLVAEGSQEPAPPSDTERSTPPTNKDTLAGSSQRVIRQSWTPQVTQNTDEVEERSERNQKAHPDSEQSSMTETSDIPADGVSPSPELGKKRQGGRPGRDRRMPSLTRKPKP